MFVPFSIIDFVKIIAISILIAVLSTMYYNYKSMKTDIAILRAEKEKLLQVNKDNVDAIEKLQQDIEKNSKVVVNNTQKKQQITKKNEVTKKDIEKLSDVENDLEYEKLINEKYRGVTKCLTGSC